MKEPHWVAEIFPEDRKPQFDPFASKWQPVLLNSQALERYLAIDILTIT